MAAEALEVEWARRVKKAAGPAGGASGRARRAKPNGAVEYFEGPGGQVTRNAYEADPNARAACLAHYGHACACCGMTFLQTYGPKADGVIHVHHIKPRSTRRARHMIDPVKDLIPLCPNCHTVLHLRTPPYTVAEVKAMMRRRGGEKGRRK